MALNRLFARKLTSDEQAVLVAQLFREINTLVTPHQLILFGSASRGEMTEASDLDVVVIVKDTHEVKPTQKRLNQLSRLMDWPVDCLVIDIDAFKTKSAIGGVYFVAGAEGRLLE